MSQVSVSLPRMLPKSDGTEGMMMRAVYGTQVLPTRVTAAPTLANLPDLSLPPIVTQARQRKADRPRGTEPRQRQSSTTASTRNEIVHDPIAAAVAIANVHRRSVVSVEFGAPTLSKAATQSSEESQQSAPSTPTRVQETASVERPVSTMKAQSIPMIIVHFRGFESLGFSAVNEQIMKLAVEMARKIVVLVAVYGGCVGVTLAVKAVLSAALNVVAFAIASFATYSSCVMLASKLGASLPATTCMACIEQDDARLPRLQLRHLAPLGGLDEGNVEDDKKMRDAVPQPTSRLPQLPAVRQRILAGLRRPPPNVNQVNGDKRKRSNMSLHQAKIRVGKAVLETGKESKKPVDMYMVRIECATGQQEKHMNPVVMWDISATFTEFKRLESDLRREVRQKRLRNLQVPHLSAGTILFVQPELTQDVLNARRVRLQSFLNGIRADNVLADLDAMRKFCQAF